MKRSVAKASAAALVFAGAAVALSAAMARRGSEGAACGPGFRPVGPRCLAGAACPPPLVAAAVGCDAPDARVRVPETVLLVGPSDWEAEGRVAPRTLRVHAFAIDAFEATDARLHGPSPDGARATSGLTRDEAAAYCAGRGGRLPTEDEWIAAAAGPAVGAHVGGAAVDGRRYPWGETGAVCRRAAWGLAHGPCAQGGAGPDTAGAHPDGDTPSGIHDMAGNVAEWVAPAAEAEGRLGVVRGGSWASALATDLRTWARLELDPAVHDPRVGVRCAYDLSELEQPLPFELFPGALRPSGSRLAFGETSWSSLPP